MEVGDTVRTPDGNGVVRSMGANTVEVLVDSRTRWYEYGKVDLMHDPIGRIHQNKTDTALRFILGIDAHRLLAEYWFNPYVLATSTKIKIFPHQINEVIWGLENPKIMIADEVGLGKTIIAALIVAEIRARGIAKRILFVVPKSLQIKWKNEMEQRFDIPTVILDADYMKTHHTLFGNEFSYVASIDFLKQDHVLAKIDADFDVVVMDEAHKMKIRTKRLNLGKYLSAKADVMILLTATPHDGRDDDFMERIKLLNPFVLDIATASYLWTRTVKEDVVDLEGMAVFPGRTSHTVDIQLLNKERDIFGCLEEYFDLIDAGATTSRGQSITRFLRYTYKKIASSSFHSLKVALERRLDKVGTQEELPADIRFSDSGDDDEDGDDDGDFEDRPNCDGVSVMDVDAEKDAIRKIIDALGNLGCDSKLDQLVRSIRAIKTDKPGAKIVVFTDYRNTLSYLEDMLDYKTGRIDGLMSISEREQALRDFRAPDGTEILLCTDAAGEGVDMQFCNIEINYDLPWNPNKLEQRMGRIHRIGQDQNVSYYNFVVDSEFTIDGYIMNKILGKIEQIKEAMGDTVYDIIGMLIGPGDFGRYYDNLRKIPSDQWEPKIMEMMSQIESTKLDIQRKRELLMEGHRLDATSVDTIRNIRKSAVMIDEVRRFVHTFVGSDGGAMELVDGEIGVYRIRPSERHALQLGLGEFRGVFDADVAQRESYDYLALGHPAVNKMLYRSASDHAASLGHETQEGVLCVFRIAIHDGDSKQRDLKIVALFEQSDGVIQRIDERSVWTYKDSDKPLNIDFLASACKRMEPQIDAAARQQKEHVDCKLSGIKEKALGARTQYYADKINKLHLDIRDLEERGGGPTVERLIGAKERDIGALRSQNKKAKGLLEASYRTRAVATLIGVAQVTADDGSDVRIRIDEAGMRAVMESERSRASDDRSRSLIVDCSKNNCGYDVESFDRKIEVKSHQKSGSIMLTDHEWQTAQRLQGEYWLYVVENVFEDPQITRIQNPAEELRNSIEQVPAKQFRWIVHDWKH
ncbi:MAG: helicase-related protein [Thaumarchaeota archaeon]|nr:helicase-related protein [Nitrososphaerota archaeon]